MRMPLVHAGLVVGICTSAPGLGSSTVTAQTNATPAAQPAAAIPARTPDGQPNLQGIWRNPPGIAVYSYDIQDPAPMEAYPAAPPGTAPGGFFVSRDLKATFVPIIVDPPDGRIPYRPWARKLREHLYKAAFRPRSLQELDPQAMCVPGGPPRMSYQGSFQIFQVPGYVIFANEWAHQYRVVPLDGRPHLTDKVKLFAGDSRGRWEGDTLVVEVTNFNGRNWLDVAGDIRTPAFTVVERWTRLGPASLRYEATIEDPNLYTRPWTMRLNLIPQVPDYYLLEEACHEGNHALQELRTPHAGQRSEAALGSPSESKGAR